MGGAGYAGFEIAEDRSSEKLKELRIEGRKKAQMNVVGAGKDIKNENDTVVLMNECLQIEKRTKMECSPKIAERDEVKNELNKNESGDENNL